MSAPAAPAITVQPDGIPAELRALPRWVGWRLEARPGQEKPAKMPITPTGGHADITNPAVWSTLADVLTNKRKRKLSGVGFVFAHEDGYVGLDFDGMPWAEVEPLVRDLLPAYVELSQSGAGIHVICKGTLPPGQRRKGSIEAYSEGRYFAITGCHPDGDLPPDVLEDRTEALAAFHATHLGDFVTPGQVPPPDGSSGLSPEEQALADRIVVGRDGKRFNKLFYHGGVDDKKVSEDRFDLTCILARTTPDDEQVRQMLWKSALKDKKWERHRTLLDIDIRNARLRHPGLITPTGTHGPLEVTGLELAQNPDLLKSPDSLSPWLTWRGEYSILVGREKLAGKSTLAGSDAMQALRAGLRVLWVTAEESQNRVLKRFSDLQAPLANLLLLRRWPQGWEEVEDVIRRCQPDVIYVDSQSSFLFAVDSEVPKTSEPEKWQAKGLRFKSWTHLAPAGVCVLVHANKSTGEYAGSVGIGAAADTIITMRNVDKQPTIRKLELRGRWGFPSRSVRYVDDVQGYLDVEGELTVTPPDQEKKKRKLGGEMLKVLEALKPGMTYSTWEVEYGGNESTFKTSVNRLKERELVTQDSRTGTWARVQFTVEQELAA